MNLKISIIITFGLFLESYVSCSHVPITEEEDMILKNCVYLFFKNIHPTFHEFGHLINIQDSTTSRNTIHKIMGRSLGKCLQFFGKNNSEEILDYKESVNLISSSQLQTTEIIDITNLNVSQIFDMHYWEAYATPLNQSFLTLSEYEEDIIQGSRNGMKILRQNWNVIDLLLEVEKASKNMSIAPFLDDEIEWWLVEVIYTNIVIVYDHMEECLSQVHPFFMEEQNKEFVTSFISKLSSYYDQKETSLNKFKNEKKAVGELVFYLLYKCTGEFLIPNIYAGESAIVILFHNIKPSLDDLPTLVDELSTEESKKRTQYFKEISNEVIFSMVGPLMNMTKPHSMMHELYCSIIYSIHQSTDVYKLMEDCSDMVLTSLENVLFMDDWFIADAFRQIYVQSADHSIELFEKTMANWLIQCFKSLSSSSATEFKLNINPLYGPIVHEQNLDVTLTLEDRIALLSVNPYLMSYYNQIQSPAIEIVVAPVVLYHWFSSYYDYIYKTFIRAVFHSCKQFTITELPSHLNFINKYYRKYIHGYTDVVEEAVKTLMMVYCVNSLSLQSAKEYAFYNDYSLLQNEFNKFQISYDEIFAAIEEFEFEISELQILQSQKVLEDEISDIQLSQRLMREFHEE